MKVYKLTDSQDRTQGGTQWGPGVRHEATGAGAELCSDGWIHWYRDPLLAVLHDPIHGDFGATAHLWEAETYGDIREDGRMKGGSRGLVTLRSIDLPAITTEQRVRYGILCARQVCSDPTWRLWAERWLSGEDRSARAAEAAAAEAAAAAAKEAARAAAWAAVAAEAAEAAAAVAARAAAWAAKAAAEEAARAEIDLVAIAHMALKEV